MHIDAFLNSGKIHWLICRYGIPVFSFFKRASFRFSPVFSFNICNISSRQGRSVSFSATSRRASQLSACAEVRMRYWFSPGYFQTRYPLTACARLLRVRKRLVCTRNLSGIHTGCLRRFCAWRQVSGYCHDIRSRPLSGRSGNAVRVLSFVRCRR